MALEISHLVTSGCSFTYCEGLDDPTTQGWPALLAKKLNVPVVNLGIRGAGNDQIYRLTSEYFFKDKPNGSKPFYIVAFTQALRREEYLIEYKNIEIQDLQILSVHGDEPIEKVIYEQFDGKGIYYSELRRLLHWLSVINLFKANNIPYFSTSYMVNHHFSMDKIKESHPNLMEYIFDDPNKVDDFYFLTKGMDKTKCKHDGPQAQEVIANYCYNKIIEKYGSVIPVPCKYTNLFEFGSTIEHRNNLHPMYPHNAWYKKETPN